MHTREVRTYHKGYSAVQNKKTHRVRIYNASNELFYSCRMEHKINEEDLISLIDALINYRKRSDLWN